MSPIQFNEANLTLAKDQPEYRPLPVMWDSVSGTVTSCWELSFRERWRLLFGGKLWLQMMNFNIAPMPIYPTVDKLEVVGFQPPTEGSES